MLFIIYINDLENKIGSNILKFADDTTNFRRVESQEDRQVDLNNLVKWAENGKSYLTMINASVYILGKITLKRTI